MVAEHRYGNSIHQDLHHPAAGRLPADHHCQGGGAAGGDLGAGEEASIRGFTPRERTRLDGQAEQGPVPEEPAPSGFAALRPGQLPPVQSQPAGLGPAAALGRPVSGAAEPQPGPASAAWRAGSRGCSLVPRPYGTGLHLGPAGLPGPHQPAHPGGVFSAESRSVALPATGSERVQRVLGSDDPHRRLCPVVLGSVLVLLQSGRVRSQPPAALTNRPQNRWAAGAAVRNAVPGPAVSLYQQVLEVEPPGRVLLVPHWFYWRFCSVLQWNRSREHGCSFLIGLGSCRTGLHVGLFKCSGDNKVLWFCSCSPVCSGFWS
ncbi:cytochrome c oxidase assembly protein COX18, mitochondrial isoform X2 [Poecilia latipinna]|uniref:cytochrome c oxidase assembly protein COX18, mitochondrial isoform X2 n=1 Tax=Poecilia latipinna TaxID=48699 RepID=UPI00072E7DD4|nr:PREDICTED: collagen alpha-2(I) chain isoform X2 [Poecilia latipinna]